MSSKKQIIFILLSLLFAVNRVYTQADQGHCRIMTFNIRYDNPDDGPFTWENRREMVISMIRFHRPDIIGIQEALKNQVDDLAQPFEDYNWFGAGREDGMQKGEFSAIFYNKRRFAFEKGNTFWLSKNPEKPGSLSWNAACTRIVTWIKIRDRRFGQDIYVFNTHFDHVSERARIEGARMLLQKIHELAGKHLVFLIGDFNCPSDSDPYAILTDAKNPLSLTDTRTVSFFKHHGPSYTFVGFPAKENPGRTIDFIFVKNKDHIKILQHGTLADHWDGFYPSDHLPVFVELQFLY